VDEPAFVLYNDNKQESFKVFFFSRRFLTDVDLKELGEQIVASGSCGETTAMRVRMCVSSSMSVCDIVNLKNCFVCIELECVS